MQIAVTGARGIIGRHVMACASAQGLRAVPLEVDLRDGAKVADAIGDCAFDAVVHLAAVVEVPKVLSDPAHALAVNAGGTLNLMEAIRRSGRKPWFFYTSTSHVYAPSDKPLTEDSAIAPRNMYAVTKYAGETICRYYEAQGAIRLLTGRVFSIFDVAQTGTYLYPTMAERVRAQRGSDPIKIADGNALRDFTPAQTIAERICALMRAGATGTVNIASGRTRPVVEQVREWFAGKAQFEATGDPPSAPIIADISRLRTLLDGKI